MYYGEFNVVVMTLSAFRSKNMLDMSYLREISVSLVIGDDLFKYISIDWCDFKPWKLALANQSLCTRVAGCVQSNHGNEVGF